MMDRRELFFGVAALVAAIAARPQAPGRVYRVGYLGYTATKTPDDERVVAAFVQRLREGDLPMEQPAKFEVIVNLKMAKAIGLTIPQSVLLRANEVVE